MKFDWRKWVSNIVILLIFIIAAAIYFQPALEGKIVYAGDNISGVAACYEGNQWKADHPEGTWWTGSVFSGMPNFQMGGHGDFMVDHILSPLRWFFSWGNRNTFFIFLFYLCAFYLLLRTFKIDRWISMAGAFAIAMSSYFFVIIAAQHHGKCYSITWMVLAVVGFLLIYRKQYGWGAIITAFFTYIGFFLHPQMSYYICMMIGIFFLAEVANAIKNREWKHFCIATVVFFASFGIGMAMGSANVFVTQEYAKETMRGGHSDLVKDTDEGNKTAGLDLDYATAWSEGIDESITFLIPNYMGGASGYDLGEGSQLEEELTKIIKPGYYSYLYKVYKEQGAEDYQAQRQANQQAQTEAKRTASQICHGAPTYWGDKAFTSGPVYMGAIVCFLFILGLLLVDNKNPYKWAILVATLFSLCLSWGRHFMPLTEFFFNYFPMYNKFRAVESILIVAEITVPLLGFLALKEIADGKRSFKFTAICTGIAGGLTALFCLVMMIMSGSIDATSAYDVNSQWKAQFDQISPQIYDAIVAQRQAMIHSDALRSLLFVLAGTASVIGFAVLKNKMPEKKWVTPVFGIILSALIVGDMWGVDKRFCNDDNFVAVKERDKAFKQLPYEKDLLKNDKSYYRVLNMSTDPFNDARTSYYFKSIGGYSAAKLRRYQDLIDEHIKKEMNPFYQALNATYGFQIPCEGATMFPVLNMLNMKYAFVPLQDGSVTYIENPYAFGNCWFVDSLVVVNNANDESDALNLYDLRHVAVYDETYAPNAIAKAAMPTTEAAKIECLKYEPNRLIYHSISEADHIAVFSEVYYPYGWKVTIDGKPAEHFRVDYLLRALYVPAGEHEIVFKFDPDAIHRGNTMAMICFVIFLLTLLGVSGWSIYKAVKNFKKK